MGRPMAGRICDGWGVCQEIFQFPGRTKNDLRNILPVQIVCDSHASNSTDKMSHPPRTGHYTGVSPYTQKNTYPYFQRHFVPSNLNSLGESGLLQVCQAAAISCFFPRRRVI